MRQPGSAAFQAALKEIDAEVIVLGAGVTGISTAIVMCSLGYKTTIVSDKIASQDSPHQSDSSIATNFAMASAYPHNLRIRNLEKVSDDSQELFRYFQAQVGSGVSKCRIFEVFEHEPSVDAAPLSDRRMNFQNFDGPPSRLKATVDPPARKEADYLWGWVFDSYFADMPIYLKHLWTVFQSLGGTVCGARVDRVEDLSCVADRIIINCLGLGAMSFCNDRSPCRIVRGTQLIQSSAAPILDADGTPLAYNYTPTADVFSRADGSPEYVHFFSRSDGWILGQTREPGSLDESGNWVGPVNKDQESVIDGMRVPEPIVSLNEELLNNWKGLKIERGALIARQGYRYYRDPDDTGVRIDSEEIGNNLLIHNYGHGGSGITMSWGSAIACASLVPNINEKIRNRGIAAIRERGEPAATRERRLPGGIEKGSITDLRNLIYSRLNN